MSDLAFIGEHLASCPECRKLAAESVGVDRAAAEMRLAVSATEMHPTVEGDLSAYVDRALDAPRRAEIDDHLRHCAICRQDVDDLTRVRRSLRPRAVHWYLIAAALTLAFVGAVFYSRHDRTPRPALTTPIRTVAVAPLRNASNDSRDAFLAVALADALATNVQQVAAVDVRSTAAVMRAGPDISGLGVDVLIEGHFLIEGNLVRVTLQLNDARSGRQVRTVSADGPRANLLALVDDLSARTLQALQQTLGVSQRPSGSPPRSANAAAYEEYLKSRAFQMSVDPADANAEIAHLRRAIELDPRFAAAYADLAIALEVGRLRGILTGTGQEEASLHYAREAVLLDPNLGRAHLALGRAETNFPARAHEVLTAIRLNDRDTQALWLLGWLLAVTDDIPRAKCLERHLLEIDPRANEVRIIGYWYMDAIDAQEAKRAAGTALAAKGTEFAGYDVLANASLLSGQLTEANDYAARAMALDSANYVTRSLAAALAAARGDKAGAENALRSFESDAEKSHWAAMRQSICYAKLGDRDRAIRWMNRAIELGNRSWSTWTKHPWLRSLQHDPEFERNVARIRADLDVVRPDILAASRSICD